MKLYSYFFSSAAFRVRIALNLKGITAEYVAVNLHPDAKEQLKPDYLALNPEGRVPAIATDEGLLGQSMAILEWLEEVYPEPALLPADPWQRARCRAFADTIACDIHPLNNVSVLAKLRNDFGADQDSVTRWYHHWIARGFDALEKHAASKTAHFLFADYPTFAEVCLIPQIRNARRFEMNLEAYPALMKTEGQCYALEAFDAARPENQPDAPKA